MVDDSIVIVPPRIYEHDFVAMRKCKHGTFLYNIHDQFIARSLDCYGEWCDSELDILGSIVRPGDVAVDVGANIGTHTVFLAQRVTERGCVVAFEPQRLVYQTLCANVALNALVNVIARQQAVGKQAETIRLPVFDPRKDRNCGCVSIQGHTGGEPVEVIRLDDLQLARCNLIKVDVEGMECDVLEGARETIVRCRPVLFVENNTVEQSSAILALLDSLNYDGYWHIGGYFNPKNFFGNPENIFLRNFPEANLLCFHRSCRVNIQGLPKVAGADDHWQAALSRMLIKNKKA